MHALSLMGMNYGGAIYKTCDRHAITRTPQNPVVFDGGANVGDYVQSVLDLRPNAEIHAFEPAADSYQALIKRFPAGVHLHNQGLSDRDGEATIYADEPLSESASLLPQERRHWSSHNGFQAVGSVSVCTIDRVCEDHGIERIDLLKLDIEGAEMSALRGASRMLGEQRISLIQFEYGLPAMAARVYLRDFFDLLDGWDIHRVVKDGTVPLSYHERFEILWTANYLAVPR
jgi:FkbM family methyltransferase